MIDPKLKATENNISHLKFIGRNMNETGISGATKERADIIPKIDPDAPIALCSTPGLSFLIQYPICKMPPTKADPTKKIS